MSEQPTNQPKESEQSLFKLSFEQAEQLSNIELGPEAEELLQAFGAVALEGNVALVYSKDEEGIEKPSHFIDLGSDLGTRLNLEKGTHRNRLLSVDEADRILSESQHTTKESNDEKPEDSEKKNEYADLFAPLTPVDIGPGSELTAPNEADKNSRIAELFAPRLTKSERPQAKKSAGEDIDTYTRMLTGEELPEPKLSLQEKIAKENEELKYVDTPGEEEIKAARNRLREAMSRDRIIEAIVDKYVSNEAWRGNEVVEIVRKNADLRYELGSYLLRDKIPMIKRERPHDLPDRVFVGRQKNANHTGYAHLGYLNSQEYAAMLALSMVDGTYKQPGPGDPIERGKDGRIAVGQHRAAAHILLGEDLYRIGK